MSDPAIIITHRSSEDVTQNKPSLTNDMSSDDKHTGSLQMISKNSNDNDFEINNDGFINDSFVHDNDSHYDSNDGTATTDAGDDDDEHGGLHGRFSSTIIHKLDGNDNDDDEPHFVDEQYESSVEQTPIIHSDNDRENSIISDKSGSNNTLLNASKSNSIGLNGKIIKKSSRKLILNRENIEVKDSWLLYSETDIFVEKTDSYTLPIICKVGKNDIYNSAFASGTVDKGYIKWDDIVNNNNNDDAGLKYVEWVVEVVELNSDNTVDECYIGVSNLKISEDKDDDNNEEYLTKSFLDIDNEYNKSYGFTNLGNIYYNNNAFRNSKKLMRNDTDLMFANKEIVRIALDYTDKNKWKLYAFIGDINNEYGATKSDFLKENMKLIHDNIAPDEYRLSLSMLSQNNAFILQSTKIWGLHHNEDAAVFFEYGKKQRDETLKLQQKIQQTKDENAKLKHARQKSLQEVIHLKHELKQRTGKTEEKKQETIDNSKIDELKIEINRLNNELIRQKESNESLTNDNKKITHELNEFKKKYNDINNNINNNKIKHPLSEDTDDDNDKDNIISDLKAKNATLVHQLDVSRTNEEDLENKLNECILSKVDLIKKTSQEINHLRELISKVAKKQLGIDNINGNSQSITNSEYQSSNPNWDYTDDYI